MQKKTEVKSEFTVTNNYQQEGTLEQKSGNWSIPLTTMSPWLRTKICAVKKVNICLESIPHERLGIWESNRVEFKVTTDTPNKKGAGESSGQYLLKSFFFFFFARFVCFSFNLPFCLLPPLNIPETQQTPSLHTFDTLLYNLYLTLLKENASTREEACISCPCWLTQSFFFFF